MKTETFTRKELYDLVWSTPVTTLLRKYHLKTNEFARLCKKMNIPLPNVGHWQKVQANKPIDIKQLPEDDQAQAEAVFKIREGDEKEGSVLTPLAELQMNIKNELGPELNIPARLTNPDILIEKVHKALTAKDIYLYDGLAYAGWDHLNIRVSPKNVARALRFIDVFIKAVRKRGHSIIPYEEKSTYIVVGGQKIDISIKEKLQKNSTNESWKRYEPTGIICFRVYRPYRTTEWKDGRQTLEAQLAKIIAMLELEAAELKEEAIRKEKSQAIWREKERIRVERRKLQERAQRLSGIATTS